MGLESFNIVLLPYQTNIVRNDEYWRLDGKSAVCARKLEEELELLGAVRYDSDDWVLEGGIEIRAYSCEGFFQGLELRGCLSYIKSGTQVCYKLVKRLNEQVTPLNVFVLNEEIEFEDSEELYELLKNRYREKINIFNKQYGNLQLKVTCREFYKEISKRKKWYQFWKRKNHKTEDGY